VATVLVLAHAQPSAAAVGDIGFAGFTYSPLGGSPTGSKPESKLWFNNGWWGLLWNPAAAQYRIAKLNRSTGAWAFTAAGADTRTASRSDVLWVPQTKKLYVASHYFVNQVSTSTTPAAGNGARLYRYSYNATTDSYTLDAGYPAAINNVKSETLVIDRDSTGTLWATWTYGTRPYVAHTVGGNDANWSTPYVVPGAGTTLDQDDISSLVPFGGNKIGVMWSNQIAQRFYFSVHGDGAGDTAADWTTQEVPLGATSDDHINLKADSAGKVYAAVKTSESARTAPLNVLLIRAADGTWTNTTFGTVADSHTRPIVLLDEQHRVIHMYATGPQPPGTSGQAGGDIYEKTTSMDNPAFAPGVGTPVIRNQGSPDMNDATSTKQNVDASTDTVVAANDNTANNYWHLQESLGAGGSTVTASFSATPTSGTAPLAVQFTDTSAGAPTSWSWDFGDGSPTSTAQNPSHTYTAAGTYTVTLTAANAGGADTVTKTAFIVVSAPGGGGTAATFLPTADANVQSGSPTKNYGTATSLRARAASPIYRSYLTFNVGNVVGTVTSAKLRLFVTDPSPDGGTVHPVDPAAWTETGITYDNAPALTAPGIGNFGASANTAGTWAEVDVTSAVKGNGTVSFGIDSASTNSAIYDSREGTTPPQLVVTTTGTAGGTTPAPTASFDATPTSGTSPLNVAFTDTSTGSPTSWSWDFGDGATSTAQNPSHTYTAPGTYTVSLRATNAGGSNTVTKTNLIVVSSPTGGSATTTFTPTADAYVQDGSPTKNYGTIATLRARSSAPAYRSYLTFDVKGVIGTIKSVKLRLFVTDPSPDGGHVHVVSPASWTEGGITFATAPALGSPEIASFGSVLLDAWGEADVSSAVTGNGTVSFGIDSASTNSVIYDSREGTNPPQLVVTTG